MKLASNQELDVGLARAYQTIFDLRQRALHAHTAEEAQQIQEKLMRAIEDMELIEREQIRRLHRQECVYC
jgi:hypothetical protein